MSKTLENTGLGKFENTELQDLSALRGGAATSTTAKKTVEGKSDTDSSAEQADNPSDC